MFYEAPKRYVRRMEGIDRAWYDVKAAPVNDPERSNMDHVRESLEEIAAVIKE